MRRRIALLAVLLVVALAIAAVFGVRWLLRPDNLARVITSWVSSELGAELSLADDPGVRLIPRLQLHLTGPRLERNQALLASAEELNVALPWSALWSGALSVESLHLRRPVIAWPQLTELLAELSDSSTPAATPRLPRIEVGVRVEDGTLLSGTRTEDWRLEQLSLVTTPLRAGDEFNLDAGARLRGAQTRVVSFTLRSRPVEDANGVALNNLVLRSVVAPDQRPLADGMTLELTGNMHLSAIGLSRVDLRGTLPGWPDWLPNMLGFEVDLPVEAMLDLAESEDRLRLELSQGQRHFSADLAAEDANRALAQLDQPLTALASVRGRWRLDSLQIGELRLEGIELDVESPPAADPDDSEDGSGFTVD